MKMKLIFKNGTKTIKFATFKPLGDFMFETEAIQQINRFKNMFAERKNVVWNYEAKLYSHIAEVTVSKI